jgi:hypothetical protein
VEKTVPEDPFRRDWIAAVVAAYRYHKNLADRAVAQVDFAALKRPLDENTNSIAVNMKHVAGNLASRWTDFLTSDGEKSWRRRDDEFVDDFSSGEQLQAAWEQGWDCLFQTLESLSPADLDRSITIRGEALTVAMATERSLAHTSYHVGQIVILARHWAGDRWQTLTIPRGGSAQHNQASWGSTDYARRAQSTGER